MHHLLLHCAIKPLIQAHFITGVLSLFVLLQCMKMPFAFEKTSSDNLCLLNSAAEEEITAWACDGRFSV